ncbi:hypothetical protein EVAR_75068_1 [Eumeta japonica]|uniref:Uncharacterized protein n=1 Tax=Eumeta variegata TaxID=151549 RepID=A0A4C1W0K8_EUMVA|nr:hypothetical protein EVAR_75068_1 [Eumeta japonica]
MRPPGRPAAACDGKAYVERDQSDIKKRKRYLCAGKKKPQSEGIAERGGETRWGLARCTYSVACAGCGPARDGTWSCLDTFV